MLLEVQFITLSEFPPEDENFVDDRKPAGENKKENYF
jgi:hypothetical protein